MVDLGLPVQYARLQRVDPEAARTILPNDRVRIERALEVHALSGRTLSELQRTHRFSEARYPARFIFLDPPRDLLRERIGARTSAMLAPPDSPLLRETRWLLDRVERSPDAAKALKIIGYGEDALIIWALGTKLNDILDNRVRCSGTQLSG